MTSWIVQNSLFIAGLLALVAVVLIVSKFTRLSAVVGIVAGLLAVIDGIHASMHPLAFYGGAFFALAGALLLIAEFAAAKINT